MEQTDPLPETAQREIATFVDDWLVREEVPGASLAVVDRDGVAYAEGFGARDVAASAPATPDTLYHVGSVTKLFTATAVLQLVESGALALDDEVREYVDFLADVPGDPVTVRELLTHTSGMPTDSLVQRDTVADRADFRRHVNGAADWRVTDDEPFMYFNSGYKILGEVVAAVDGRGYADYVDAEVLTPLGMDRTTFDPTVIERDDDAMTGYRTEDGERVPQEEPLDFESQPADGGLVAPVLELARFLRCLLAGGELDGTRVLPAARVEEMCRCHATMYARIDGSEQGYGYGTMVEPVDGDRLVGHTGTTFVSGAFAAGFRESGRGVVLAFNGTGLSPDDLGRGVLAILRGESPAEAVPGLGLTEKFDRVTGTYESYRGGPTVVVEPEDGHLSLTFEEWDLNRRAFPETADPDDDTFYTVGGDGRRVPVEFRSGDDGLRMLWTRGVFRRTDGAE